MEMEMYPPELPEDCLPPPDVVVADSGRVTQMPAAEFCQDTAFDAWWRTHGTYVASWETNPVSIAEAAWTAALEWQRLASVTDRR